MNNHVGAAAVSPLTRCTKVAYMGNSETSTVYAAELQCIRLALQIADEDAERAILTEPKLATKAIDLWNRCLSLGTSGVAIQHKEAEWSIWRRLKVRGHEMASRSSSQKA